MNKKKGINAIVSGVHSPARFRFVYTDVCILQKNIWALELQLGSSYFYFGYGRVCSYLILLLGRWNLSPRRIPLAQPHLIIQYKLTMTRESRCIKRYPASTRGTKLAINMSAFRKF